MQNNFYKRVLLLFVLISTALFGYAQGKGSLFIIGGGERSDELTKTMVETAKLRANDYIVILPMATSVPEESITFISAQLAVICSNKIASFNFSKAQANDNQSWIDSVKNARMIYITGGDQNKFMAVVQGTKLYDAMHVAFNKGGTIAGTSAGAAVMSQIMITGEDKGKKSSDAFKEVKVNSAVTSQGMGFVSSAIIDQHFIKRSRYNRLLSVLGDHPDKTVIGIDESTAIIITGKKVTVTGESQVLVLAKPKKLKLFGTDKISFKNARLSLYSSGQSFTL
jgi:cyanophycinase